MPSRSDKERVLKDNLDKAVDRSKRDYQKETGKQMSETRQQMEKKEFSKAVTVADKMLDNSWNDESSQGIDTSKRPMFGTYFGGVNFDKDGKIIR